MRVLEPLAAVALTLAAGCAERALETRRAPALRLAELMAEAPGEPPAARVGDVTRYVIAPVPAATVYPGPGAPAGLRVPPDGTLALPLACPPALAGRVVALEALVMARPVAVPAAWTCTPDGPPLRLGGLVPGAKVGVEVVARAAPADRVETPWLDLPPDAELRLALGLADPGPPAAAVPARFRLTARAPDGRTRVLVERRLDPARRRGDGGWRERRVPLEPVRRALGGRIALAFETAAGPAPRPAFPVWGDATVYAPAPAGAQRPNVVLVSLDALRADRVGAYGSGRPTSPRLDALAAAGALFTTAVSNSTWTLPSHATMLTGTYACLHGLGVDTARRLPAGVVPIAEVLRGAGWRTAAFTEDAYMDPVAFQRGFDLFAADTSVDFHHPEGRAARTFRRARRWLARDASEPFFLFVHTYQVHAPYTPPPGWRARLDAAAPPPADADLAAYDAELRYTDAMLGRLLDGLARRGLLERTLVVVTSDHGEAFGEHGQRFHGPHLYEENVRIPLVLRGPGVAAGRRVDTPVALVDLVPTLLELVGAQSAGPLQGTSVAAWVRPDAPPPARAERSRFVEAPMGVGPRYPVAVFANGWKAIVGPGGTVEAYALGDDPHERHPLRDPALAARAVGLRDEFLAACGTARAALPAAGGGPAALPDAERERKLRALGYLE